MAQEAKCLSCQCGDPSADPQNPRKAGRSSSSRVPVKVASVKKKKKKSSKCLECQYSYSKKGDGDKDLWKAYEPASLAYVAVNIRKLGLKQILGSC